MEHQAARAVGILRDLSPLAGLRAHAIDGGRDRDVDTMTGG